jgi:membrane protease YdiL (CAAX protease family)
MAAVAAAIVEEAFFRRMIMDAVFAAGGDSLVQVAGSALIFGVAHGVWGIVTGRMVVGIGIMVATGTLGIALAVVYLVGERSLAPVVISHFIITATIQPGITYAAFSGQMRLPGKNWWRITSR